MDRASSAPKSLDCNGVRAQRFWLLLHKIRIELFENHASGFVDLLQNEIEKILS